MSTSNSHLATAEQARATLRKACGRAIIARIDQARAIKALKAHGYPQQSIADRAGLSQGRISQIARDVRISALTIEMIPESPYEVCARLAAEDLSAHEALQLLMAWDFEPRSDALRQLNQAFEDYLIDETFQSLVVGAYQAKRRRRQHGEG